MNIYPDNFEQKTGFDKIRQLVDNKCLSSLGQECVDDIKFLTDIRVIEEKLEQTNEFVQIIREEDSFPAGCFIDVRHSLKRIKPEGTFLDEKELFDLKRSLRTISDITRFFNRPKENDETKYPALTELAGNIPVFPQIISKIDDLLDKYGRMKDNASPELLRIRKEMTATMGSISRNLLSILKSAQAEGFIDKDVTPTMRDGRLVIPVSPSFKRKIRGIVHDESATGKTVFIEPEAVVEANNRIRELESEEKRETVRILTFFTDMIRPSVPDIIRSFIFLAKMDFIRAKALFAIEINGIKPVIEDKPFMIWNDAVHPLLYLSLKKQEKNVVPLDIELYDDKRLLVISGPNAGGKSVCLKTVGLLQYMLQCGLLIPVRENSRAGVFDHIFIDIGDEQSIENDLSTYSSHLTNMKFFERNCNEKTLLLIDEFGSGTEPLIGGALAEALLDRFNRNGSFGVITTHYQNLKQYAEDHSGVINGAMLYDRHLMQPLFKLSAGRPGSSFAIEIARKTGLPEEVISIASEKVGSDYIDMDKYLQDIVRDKRYWESKRQNIRQQEKKLEDVIARYEQDLETVNKQRKEIVQAAKKEAQQILSEANAKIEKTIREIKEAQAEKERTKSVRRELESFKTALHETSEEDEHIARKMEKLHERQERKKQRRKKTPAAPDETGNARSDDSGARNEREAQSEERRITVGDTVRMEGQDAVGTVMEIKDKQVIVAFGMIKSAVKADKLEKISRSRLKKEARKNTFVSAQTADSIYEKKLNFKQEIDVRGMRGNEALQTVTYFIDDAILANVSPVRILHGTGTGILRQLIRDYLSTVPGIKQYKDEHVQFGGAGITVVELE
ncbi:MAG: Smr/MutS family protein [Tannerella sp.]|jgi:DNA mismatch repair protein MutS2|nr:Smr/MutS family protein [Tannerella sp.]